MSQQSPKHPQINATPELTSDATASGNKRASGDERVHERGDERSGRGPDVKFRRGLEQFNAGHFFDAHETWEEIWLRSAEPEKTFLQGIIQIAAAFHHYGRGNLQGTRSLLEAGLKKVARFPEAHRGIGVEALRESAREWIAALVSGEDPGATKVPQIRHTVDE